MNEEKKILSVSVKALALKIANQSYILPFNYNGGISELTFKSTNSAICAVSADGTLTPKKAGVAVITITAAECNPVTVTVTVS